MTEIAFLVKPDSEMYRKYFKQKNELDKFVGFASSFIDKYFVSRNKDFDYSFSTNMRLTVKLPPNDEEWFGAQLMKEKSESGLCVFKKNSPMNKRWHEEVTSHINPYSLTASKWWFMDFPYCGKCQIAMWDDGCGNVYGYYSTPAAHHNSGKLPNYVQPIKMSEYYIAQERCKELDSLLSEAVDKGSRASHIGSYKATFKKTSDGSDGTGFEDSTSVCFSVEHCAMPSNTRTAIVGLLHDYCLKNQRSLDDLTEFEYLGPAEITGDDQIAQWDTRFDAKGKKVLDDAE